MTTNTDQIQVTVNITIGTEWPATYEAWEPGTYTSHATIRRIDGEVHGRIGTKISDGYGDDRRKATHRAIAAILGAHPHLLADGAKIDYEMGTVTLDPGRRVYRHFRTTVTPGRQDTKGTPRSQTWTCTGQVTLEEALKITTAAPFGLGGAAARRGDIVTVTATNFGGEQDYAHLTKDYLDEVGHDFVGPLSATFCSRCGFGRRSPIHGATR